jgi:hypothetical protein
MHVGNALTDRCLRAEGAKNVSPHPGSTGETLRINLVAPREELRTRAEL